MALMGSTPIHHLMKPYIKEEYPEKTIFRQVYVEGQLVVCFWHDVGEPRVAVWRENVKGKSPAAISMCDLLMLFDTMNETE
jgi:hypothetical protein